MEYTADNFRYDNMVYNRCGNSGLKLPVISLGLWQNFGSKADVSNMKSMLFKAFDNGITHFDLANNYGPVPGSAEINFGSILKSDLKKYRDELIISTKAGYTMWDGPYGDHGSRKYLIASLDQSLMRMGLDYVDIFYHHRMDPETPLEETMLALSQIVISGKALYVGLSNYDGSTMLKAAGILRELKCPFIINQNRYSILDRRIEINGLKKASKSNGTGTIVFSPLEQGILAGRYLNGIPAGSRFSRNSMYDDTEIKIEKAKKLNEIAKKRGQTLAQMSLSWVLKDSDITSVLMGASSPEQIKENLGIIGAPEFSTEEITEIDSITAL